MCCFACAFLLLVLVYCFAVWCVDYFVSLRSLFLIAVWVGVCLLVGGLFLILCFMVVYLLSMLLVYLFICFGLRACCLRAMFNSVVIVAFIYILLLLIFCLFWYFDLHMLTLFWFVRYELFWCSFIVCVYGGVCVLCLALLCTEFVGFVV